MLAALALAGSGCLKYGAEGRGPGPTYARLPAAEINPPSAVRWSLLYSGITYPYSPLKCIDGSASPTCRTMDPCDGKGMAAVDVELPPYSFAMAVLTLGLAVPARVTIRCSTSTAPETGP